MAALNFAKLFLVLHLSCTAFATSCEQSVNIFANGRRVLVQNLSACSTSVVLINGEKITVPPLSRVTRFLHHVSRRSTSTAEESSEGSSASLAALQETAKLLRTATMLPAETLQVLRMVAVPLLNTTLALPANILEGVATMSLGKQLHGMKARTLSAGNGLWGYLAHLKQKPHPSLSLHKNITLGPLSFSKVLEIGVPRKVVTTPPPEVVVPETTPAPMALVPVTTPAPMALVPVTTPPPMAVIPDLTTPASIVPEPANPASVVHVVATPGVALPVAVAQAPPKVCTSQVAIVQNSPAAADISEN